MKTRSATLLIIALLVVTTPAAAQSLTAAQSRAKRFLDGEAQGRDVLVALHLGAGYMSHHLREIVPAPDGSGTWLNYDFVWDDRFGGTGHTQLMFGLAPDGQLRGFRVAATDAFWSEPFDVANAGLAVARDALWELARHKMKPADYQRLKSIMTGLDQPTASDLLLVYLSFQMYTRGIF